MAVLTVLLDKAETPEQRSAYASAAVEYGWSRNVLMNMMMNKTLERTGAAPSNFVQQLVAPDSELAQQVAKDPTTSNSSDSPEKSPNAISRTP
ncbi:putative nuclease of restriction endonuclease-like (RecB) superfamily [Arthrobacter sp. V4I6]|nr:putative nuclease of restriction endonuclease-like (RecB) superfamily [Arthrobacter sp. V1I7]MDQ0853580.1 putative nuclease of restriction endonuclease-like (RecB) superfamily [Arthrobacter sp. V4I6]